MATGHKKWCLPANPRSKLHALSACLGFVLRTNIAKWKSTVVLVQTEIENWLSIRKGGRATGIRKYAKNWLSRAPRLPHFADSEVVGIERRKFLSFFHLSMYSKSRTKQARRQPKGTSSSFSSSSSSSTVHCLLFWKIRNRFRCGNYPKWCV